MNTTSQSPLPPALKIHQHLVNEVAESLAQIFFGNPGAHAEKVVEQTLFRQKKWGSRDRKFYAESVYEVVRWWRRLWWAQDCQPSADKAELIRTWCLWWSLAKGEAPLHILQALPASPGWSLEKIQQRYGSVTERAVRESIPDWLDQRAHHELGESWPAILSNLNQQAPVDLRVNTLRADTSQVKKSLESEGFEIDGVSGQPEVLTLRQRKNIFITQAFKQGWLEVQDRGSQKISALLPVQPGDRVVDACAGSGGKTLHLAARMKNRGKILALDIHAWKLQKLRDRASRAGVQIIETRPIESSKTIKRLADTADAVLLDVPCSGLGVLRRHSDTKWKLSLGDLQQLLQTQAEILQLYSKMTKPGGMLVYATCSILPSENEQQVQTFLEKNPEWTLKEQNRWNPDPAGGDGFFAALLQRTS